MGRMDRPAFASRPQPAHDVGILLSDAERANAMSALGHAFSHGRLTIDEYDSRCQKIAQARTRGDVEKHFVDLPEDWRRVATASSAVSRLYTAEEITQARQRGSHPRLALMLLTSIGALGAMIASNQPLVLAIIPALWVILYVAKIGPAQWHAPSESAIRREQARRIRAETNLRLERDRAQRKEIRNELTNRLYGYTQELLDRRGK